MDPVPDPLADALYTYCDVNAPEMIETLYDRIRRGEVSPERVNAIRTQLINAIHSQSITPEQFNELTHEDLTAESVIKRLREIFADLFPDEEVPTVA